MPGRFSFNHIRTLFSFIEMNDHLCRCCICANFSTENKRAFQLIQYINKLAFYGLRYFFIIHKTGEDRAS